MQSNQDQVAEHQRLELVPRFHAQGYSRDDISRRRRWLEERTDATLDHLGTYSIESESMRGNVENPIGVAQVPIGIAGPMHVLGQHANGQFYVPLATTEGALVRSYERGMRAISHAGGARVRIVRDSNRSSPIFSFAEMNEAAEFAADLPNHFEPLKRATESTTSHGELVSMQPHVLGRDVVVDFDFFTGDAHGMNMISRATEEMCKWLKSQFAVERYYVLSGGSLEKRASSSLFHGGKGKHVTAEIVLPKRLVQTHLHCTPADFFHVFQRTMMAQLQAGSNGYNGHLANGLTALFIACGQDVANIANSAVGLTHFDVSNSEDLRACVTLPSLTVATVGGGTGLGTARQSLSIMGCHGAGKAGRLAEIACATGLAGELSFGAALASGEFVNAHEQYGRNR